MSATVIIALLLMGLLGLALGAIIGLFVKFFRVETDPRIDLALELLPGANCGGCGKAGCADFAKALAAGEVSPGGCPVSSAEQQAAIAIALGIDAGDVVRKQAVVLCRADIGEAHRMNYNGVQDCVAANLVAGGPDACRYGCLGLGSCARSCPFGAIEIVGRVAVVHPELCVGCGKCISVCPRNVIKLVPADAKVHVYCNSPEKGAVKRSYCKAGCIGCRKCERQAPEQFKVDGFLAQINYSGKELPCPEDVEKLKCPAGGLMTVEARYDAARQAAGIGRINHENE